MEQIIGSQPSITNLKDICTSVSRIKQSQLELIVDLQISTLPQNYVVIVMGPPWRGAGG